MATTRFEIEKFDGETNFNLWQVRMMAILVQSIVPCEYGIAGRIDREDLICLVEKNVEVHIDDEDQAMLLLCSLPPSYKSFRETLIYGRDKLSLDDVKVSTSNNSKLTSEWILDSGCSFHICPNREWFSTYSSVEVGVVHMGNHSSSKVISIGTVKIKMHDRTTRALSDVRYVPDLRKNLISLSILDLKGCRINIKSSGIKVSRGALVLLKGKRTDSLYILEGSIVTGEIGHPSSVAESKSTRLEWRQLGHIREKCMTVSLKRGFLLDTGFEKLGHCVRENQTRVSFDLTVYKSKARSLLVSKHKFNSVNSLHSSR
ncbi:hypothetical protein CXB51_001771 [Gossypium anomalum]|uniref:Retrovirus-related Pol polyprotein from transposon TNT 1-94-like beta-barrel domain-containing protein n=1 Tax=Gossypium anomalum TaxID=47600 RepID=A0A8J5ZLH2_9ROSI|nr:hypothetical protein CXB51_001771 [Gossypium anomalum]